MMGEHSQEKRVEMFWKRIDGLHAGLIGLKGTDRLIPMAHYTDPEAGCLWFIGHDGTELAERAETGPQDAVFAVTSDEHGIYTHVHGTLTLSHDEQKLDELWSKVAASWFEDGRRDPDIRLLCLTLRSAEVWTSTTSAARFLYETAKGNLSESKPDVGDKYSLTF